MTDQDLKQLQFDGDYSAIVHYFWAAFATDNDAQRVETNRQYDDVLTKKTRAIINKI